MRENLEVRPLLFINNINETSPVTKMQSIFSTKLKSPKSTKKIDKPKKSMNDNSPLTMEKINFLSQFPKEIPSVKCEIKTSEKVYVGRIMNERDHFLEILMFGQTQEIIDKRKIEEINIVGF